MKTTTKRLLKLSSFLSYQGTLSLIPHLKEFMGRGCPNESRMDKSSKLDTFEMQVTSNNVIDKCKGLY
jgi:hypothetical protein